MLSIKEIITIYRKRMNVSPEECADYIGISRDAFFRRMRDSSIWRLGELNALYEFLGVEKEIRKYE